jgi:hypothetical protein
VCFFVANARHENDDDQPTETNQADDEDDAESTVSATKLPICNLDETNDAGNRLELERQEGEHEDGDEEDDENELHYAFEPDDPEDEDDLDDDDEEVDEEADEAGDDVPTPVRQIALFGNSFTIHVPASSSTPAAAQDSDSSIECIDD